MRHTSRSEDYFRFKLMKIENLAIVSLHVIKGNGFDAKFERIKGILVFLVSKHEGENDSLRILISFISNLLKSIGEITQ